jgi:hypothetical protein
VQHAPGSWHASQGVPCSSGTFVAVQHCHATPPPPNTHANALCRLWAGTDDGRVLCWRLAVSGHLDLVHAWQAHKAKVKSLALTAWGKLATGGVRGGGPSRGGAEERGEGAGERMYGHYSCFWACRQCLG